MKTDSDLLLATLKQYFGYTSFRPLQEEIIKDSLRGSDVFALLPTGGGKSLCYQLPALVRDGLTVVVSPLIALMKDQVQAMETCGVAATFLNSSLEADEARVRLRALHQGKYRLLYVAPERLMLPDFLSDLKSWNVSLIAIDESHCISEWGHDFRPEYRKLSELREHFPKVPMMALTATATPRVQKDILHQLRLKTPGVYTASFNRPNLKYRILPKQDPREQTLKFLEEYQNESGIIYCQSRKSTESVAEFLKTKGIKALPYHAGLSSEERSRNQDLFLKDEARVICATIAFGMGIHKSNVRFVIHYDLPKNIEGYYQETGRAGRDGLASECLLLFSPGDAMKQSRFIEEKSDPKEREMGMKQLSQMIHYAESTDCRRKTLLGYFGEVYEPGTCQTCDNCLSPRAAYDGTIQAQKFISCIYRIREKSGFNVGMKHIIEVLTGADTEKINRWQHQELSTYGIGKEHSRNQWAAIGRELVRLGLIAQSSGKFSVLEITEEGRSVLNQRKPVLLTQAIEVRETKSSKPKTPAEGGTDFDPVLFERLRQLRKKLADQKFVPAYLIFSDATLRQMARDCPQDPIQFSRISGVGEKKLQEFGEIFLKEIVAYVKQIGFEIKG